MSQRLPDGRPSVDQKLDSRCRKLVREIIRQDDRAVRASAAARAAREEFGEVRAATVERFNREVPADGLLLDLLDLIEVDGDDRWIWHGLRNNYGLAIVRDGRAEQSLVRYLALAFGVIGPEEEGMLFPQGVGPGSPGDVDDVNPWHRVLRKATRSMGNRGRFALPEERTS